MKKLVIIAALCVGMGMGYVAEVGAASDCPAPMAPCDPGDNCCHLDNACNNCMACTPDELKLACEQICAVADSCVQK